MPEGLSVYVSGRISRQDEIKAITDALEAEGLHLSHKWAWQDSSMSESDAHLHRKRNFSVKDPALHDEVVKLIEGAASPDIFIILTDLQGTAMYGELGAALLSHQRTGKPSRLYAIGPHFDRMILYQHEAVQWVDSVKDIINDLRRIHQ